MNPLDEFKDWAEKKDNTAKRNAAQMGYQPKESSVMTPFSAWAKEKDRTAAQNAAAFAQVPKNTPTRQSFTGLAAGAAGATGAGKGLGPTIPQPVKRVSPGLAGEAMNRKNTIEANIKKSGAPGAQLLSRTRQPETATAAAPKITLPNYASYMAIEDNSTSDRWWEGSENLIAPKPKRTTVQNPTFGDRVEGLLTSTGAGMANIPFQIYDYLKNVNIGKAQEAVDRQAKLEEFNRRIQENPDIFRTDPTFRNQYVQLMRELESTQISMDYPQQAKRNPSQRSEISQYLGNLEQTGQETLKKGLGPAGQLAADIASNGLDVAARMMVSTLTGIPLVVILGVEQAAESGQQALDEGYSPEQSFILGSGSGMISAGVESLTGIGGNTLRTALSKIPGVQKLVAQLPTKVVAYLSGLSGSKLGQILGDGLGEATEEIVEYDLQRVYENLILDKDTPRDIKEQLYSGLVGGVIGLGFGAARNFGTAGRGAESQEMDDAGGRAVVGGLNQNSANGQKPRITAEQFTNVNDPVWNHVDYNDKGTQARYTAELSERMLSQGQYVELTEDDLGQFAEYFPDLRSMKKSERTPILKEKIGQIKSLLRKMLETDFKGKNIEFEVNGNILDAKLYDTGIREVLEKLTPTKSSMLAKTGEIFSKAQYLYSTQDKTGNPQVLRWNYFYVPLKVDNDILGVRVALRDMSYATNSQIYNWGIKNRSDLAGGAGRNEPARTLGTSVASINSTIPQGQSEVNSSISNPGGVDAENSLTPPPTVPTMESEVHTTGGVDLGRTGEEAQQIREYEPGRALGDYETEGQGLLWNRGKGTDSGTEETQQRFLDRARQTGREVQRIGDRVYSYRVIPEGEISPNARQVQREFAALGFENVPVIDELQKNQHGTTQIDRGEAVTLPNGDCFIRNDVVGNPKEVASHDATHMIEKLYPEVYSPYYDTVFDGNLIHANSNCISLSEEIIRNYFFNLKDADGKRREFDITVDYPRLYQEFGAFISGAINSDPEFADAFFGPMFQDWESVKSAQAWMFEQVRSRKNISPVNPTSNRTEANHPQADPDRALRTAGGLLPDGKEAPQNFIGWPIGQGNDSLGFSAGLPDIGGTVQQAAEEVSQFFTPKPPLTGDRRDLSEGFNLDDLGRGESAFDGVRELLAASAADGKANKKAPKTGPANILTETPKVQLRENFEDTAGWAYRKAVDSGHSVEQAAKLVGDEVLYPLYNNAKQAGAAAGYMMGEAQTDLRGNRVGKSLLEIFDPVRAKGEQYFRDFSAYLFHLHNMDRMSLETRGAQVYEELGLDVPADLENKPVFGEEVTAQDSEKAAAELLQKYPEFQQMAQDVYRYNQNLMQYRVDSGLISEKQAQLMNALYPHYVPTFRKTGKSSGMTVFGGQAKVAQTVQKATGSNLDLMPIDDSIARQTVRVISAAKRNLFGNRLLSDALRNRDKIGRYVQSVFDAEAQYDLDTEGEIETPPNLKGQFTVYLSGKPVAMKLDAGMMEGIQALSPQLEYNLVMKGIREANNLYKALITGYNPSFMIRNPLKDIQDAGLYTTDLKGFVRNYPRAVGEIRSNGKMWQLYRSYGGTGSSFFDYEKGLQPKKEGGLIQRIQSVNEALEQLPRLAEFITVVEKGGTGYENVQKALLAAADVTVNFGRSGTWGKSLNQTAVPFLNPSIQGADKLYRTITSTKSGRQWAMLALRVALLGVAPSVINELLYRDDEDYQQLSNRTKDTYFLFKLPKLPGLNLPEGQFLKLPKGRVLSVFGNAAQRTMRTWRGEEDAWDGYLETTLDATAPASPFSSNILTPVLDADLFDPESPGKTWYGGDIEPQRLRSLPPGERYDESTDAISKTIGGFFNLSPKKINYLLDSYTGAIGEYGLPLITPKAEGNPFVNSFVVDSVMSNKYSSQFYDKLDEVTQDKNSANPMPGSAVTNRFLTRKASEFGELYAEMRRIELSSLSNKEKMSQVRKVKEQLNDAQKDTLDALDRYQEAAAKYYAKYSSMEEDDRLDTAYREANREIFGAEYALEVYNKKTYEKAQAANEKGIPYDTFYRAYFAQKDVQGNKDRKGNTIAGSASENKKKAVDRVISGLTRRQREALYEAFNISKTAW